MVPFPPLDAPLKVTVTRSRVYRARHARAAEHTHLWHTIEARTARRPTFLGAPVVVEQSVCQRLFDRRNNTAKETAMNSAAENVIFTDSAFPVRTPWEPPAALRASTFDADRLFPVMLAEIERRKAQLAHRRRRARR